jgi:transposase-like protein
MQMCPNYEGTQIVKNDFVYYGKQNFKCKACGWQFVENGRQNQISAEKRNFFDKLLVVL